MRNIPIALVMLAGALLAAQQTLKSAITWDEVALHEWATPIAGLNVRPGHFSPEEYHKAPVDNVRTYPVYFPGREPAGYWEMLQSIGPKPLIEPAALMSDADWVRAGQRVFDEFDIGAFRVFDPQVIAFARSPEGFAGSGVKPRADGTLPDLRWIPTSRGVALGLSNCAPCHTRLMPDGTLLRGAPSNETPSPIGRFRIARWGASAVELAGDVPPMTVWRSWAVPWIKDDIHESLKTASPGQIGALFGAAAAPGLFPRWNGSAFYPTKIPDLIGIKDRKYIDHTATHQHRGPGDLMRYAALVTFSDSSDFGPHRMLTDEQRHVPFRAPDEALYALAMFIYSLEPPANPNRDNPGIADGQRVFQREGCGGCHTPPLYTNNRLTLASGFTPPAEHFSFLDIMRVSVGTDPNLALKTRKGTGYYKVPSLKGVWYRGRYLHDGSLTTLEEMFDPARLRDDYARTGFMPPGEKTRAIPGHVFGLKLNETDRVALMAFLRSL
jgi:mono/diheme cytochrome c family protein